MSALSRRQLLKALGGTALLLSASRLAAAEAQTEVAAPPPVTNAPRLNVALIGAGRQGLILLEGLLKIPGIHIVALCDIWEYSSRTALGRCRAADQEPTAYTDYRELLDKEKSLHAVIVATPDFWHERMTVAALQSGLAVYCEKEMAHTLESARRMVIAARETGKLLQIGHQRRSNPYYHHGLNLLRYDRFCGNLTLASGQWNQLKPVRALPKRLLERWTIPDAVLSAHGYDSMAHFYEWRWFSELGGGPACDLGSHQLDVLNWYVGAPPSRIFATAGNAWARAQALANEAGFIPESDDHVHMMLNWKLPDGSEVNGNYQVNLTTSHGGFYETFGGDAGTIVTAEITEQAAMFRENTAAAIEWNDLAQKVEVGGKTGIAYDPLASRRAKGQMDAVANQIAADLQKPPHQPHLENFFAAVRGEGTLNCPAELGYETAVTVFKAIESARLGRPIELKPADFIA